MKHKKCRVVRLATKGLSNIAIGNETGRLLYFPAKGVTNELHNNKIQTQHLYILSDEEIKEGDYFMNTGTPVLSEPASLKDCTYIKQNNLVSLKKIIVSTDQSLGLPRPSGSFIKKYCELGGIDEVLVEYITTVAELGSIEPYRSHPEDLPNYISNPILKVAPDNTITIKAIKDSWTREEVKDLIKKYSRDTHGIYHSPDMNNWIKENL